MNGYILKGRVIDGYGGEPAERGVVMVEGDKITCVCAENEFRKDADLPVIEIDGGTILPGFIDCHTHLTSLGMKPEAHYTRPKYDSLLEAVSDAKKMLHAGFTSAREMGEFGPYIKRAVAKGFIAGPKLFVGCKMLSGSSGHGDIAAYLDRDYAQRNNIASYMVDGVDECLKGVRMQFREGAEFIKICTTGGVMSSGDEVDSSEFSVGEIRAMVEEAEQHNTYVASHSIGNLGIRRALESGVKCIEHGIFLDEYCVELMVKNDCTLCPTLTIVNCILENPQDVPPYAYRKALIASEGHARSLQMAHKAGVRIVFGTDFLGGDSKASAFGTQGREFVSLVECGLSPMEAIMSTTRNAAHVIRKTDELGVLESGKTADIVVVNGNPLEDISCLAEPDNIKIVMQNGEIV